MGVNSNESDVAEVSGVGQGGTGELTAAGASVEVESEVAQAARVVERASGEETGDGGAPGDGSVETSSPGVRRSGLREVCRAFLKRFEAGASSEGAASERSAGGGAGPSEAPREAATDAPAVEPSEDTLVLRLPDEDVRLGGVAAEAAERDGGPGPRGVLQRLSRYPAAVAIGAAASGGVSVFALSVVLGDGGSAPSKAIQHAGRMLEAMGPAEPGLMAPSAKLATVALPEPQGPVVKPQPEKKAADELREEVLSFGDRSGKAERGPAAGVSGKGDAKQVVLEPGLSGPGVVGSSGSGELGSKSEGGSAAAEAASGRGGARSGQGRDEEIRSVEASATRQGEEAPKEAGVGGDPPGFRVAVVRPEDRGRSDGTREEKSPALGQERSGDRQDKVAKEALGLVTQLGALLAEAREELAALKVDHERLRGVAEGRLGDLDTRVGFLEAKSAVADAHLAGKLPDVVASSPVPIAGPRQEPASADAPVPGSGDARIIRARAVKAGLARETGGLRRYRVQAASPNLAMLAEIDRSGDIGAQIEVALGDKVAGYGRVTKIVQRGTAWVVQTEKGPIE